VLRLGITQTRHPAPVSATGDEMGKKPGPRHPIVSVAFSPDGNLVASGSAGDRAIFLWDRTTGVRLRKIELECTTGGSWCGEHDASVLSFSPDGKTVASWTCDGAVHFAELETGKQRSFRARNPWVKSAGFAPDRKTVALLPMHADSRTMTVAICATANGREMQRIRLFDSGCSMKTAGM
jgi:WD40 repeat protein